MYALGDTATAEERLDLVAAVFEPPSRAFLATVVTEPPRLACDLGCGPGNTTRLIRSVTGARQVIGLDSSAAFVRSAGSRAGEGVGFRVWQAGFPLAAGGAADLVYARLLLAHLPAAARLAASWAAQLAPGGQLLLDEVARIDTGSDVLREYLSVVVARIAASGADMYAGPLLDDIQLPAGCRIGHDEVVAHPVAAADAARMFLLNLSVWGDDPWVSERFGHDAAARLGRELGRIAAGLVRCEITWFLRQVAIRRTR